MLQKNKITFFQKEHELNLTAYFKSSYRLFPIMQNINWYETYYLNILVSSLNDHFIGFSKSHNDVPYP